MSERCKPTNEWTSEFPGTSVCILGCSGPQWIGRNDKGGGFLGARIYMKSKAFLITENVSYQKISLVRTSKSCVHKSGYKIKADKVFSITIRGGKKKKRKKRKRKRSCKAINQEHYHGLMAYCDSDKASSLLHIGAATKFLAYGILTQWQSVQLMAYCNSDKAIAFLKDLRLSAVSYRKM